MAKEHRIEIDGQHVNYTCKNSRFSTNIKKNKDKENYKDCPFASWSGGLNEQVRSRRSQIVEVILI
jgi:hypothetical protein